MKFGLNPDQYQFILQTVVEPLELKGAIIWCYGSRARGDHKKYSDLDLMVDSKNDVTSDVAAIREKLENSNFPLKVDLVTLDSFASSYRPGFERDKVLFKD